MQGDDGPPGEAGLPGPFGEKVSDRFMLNWGQHKVQPQEFIQQISNKLKSAFISYAHLT